MRFLFVDKITRLTDTEVEGHVEFGQGDPMQYEGGHGAAQISPAIVSEAVGQLCSWLVIKRTDFKLKPVYLFSDRIDILRPVAPGSRVELSATIQQMDAETCTFSGQATVAGETVLTITNCTFYFMPIEQLEDPEVVKARFVALVAPEQGAAAEAASELYDFNSLIDTVVARELGRSITIKKRMKTDEPFYRDHFPRFPVTPAVLINEMIGRATALALAEEGERRLMPIGAAQVKVRSFVRPGEECEVSINIQKIMPAADGAGQDVATVGEIKKDGKVILRGRYNYRIKA